ncbi:hypothetical protein F528_1046 [Neisseria meningitidis 992008]|nr:hypothetical protein F528_1046 [Neisseria meningitidis 992008]
MFRAKGIFIDELCTGFQLGFLDNLFTRTYINTVQKKRFDKYIATYFIPPSSETETNIFLINT